MGWLRLGPVSGISAKAGGQGRAGASLTRCSDVRYWRKADMAPTDALHPLGHMGEADDIAWGAVYLASDEAKFVTGSELVIDGGYTAR